MPDFETVWNRRGGDSTKWNRHDPDVIEAWVADMDFPAADAIRDALARRTQGGFFGYADPPAALEPAIGQWLHDRFEWDIDSAALTHLPGVVNAFNTVLRLCTSPGDGVLVPSPVYPPMLAAPAWQGRELHEVPLALHRITNHRLRYELDLDALAAAVTPRTRLLLWCAPQNPSGRVWTQVELEAVAEFCLRHDLWVCSDDIWAELTYERRHLPLVAAVPELADRVVTIMAPSKAFNIPSLSYAYAITHNTQVAARLADAEGAYYAAPNPLGMHAALAAYTESAGWLDALRVHLQHNRDRVSAFIDACDAPIAVTHQEATYLAWIDCRQALANPYEHFLSRGRVALSDGAPFGRDMNGFVRLNYGCSLAGLEAILERMTAALQPA